MATTPITALSSFVDDDLADPSPWYVIQPSSQHRRLPTAEDDGELHVREEGKRLSNSEGKLKKRRDDHICIQVHTVHFTIS